MFVDMERIYNRRERITSTILGGVAIVGAIALFGKEAGAPIKTENIKIQDNSWEGVGLNAETFIEIADSSRSKAVVSAPENTYIVVSKEHSKVAPESPALAKFGHVIIGDRAENFGYSSEIDSQNHTSRSNQHIRQPETPKTPRQP